VVKMFSSKMWSKERVQLRRNIKVNLSIWSIWQNYESGSTGGYF
jgi:hypothetical protein